MNFLHDTKSSLYNPHFYASLRERTLGSSLKYFFFLVSILAFVIAFAWGSQLAPLFSGENLKKLVNYYPAELTLTIKGGAISTNVTEPYFIKADGELFKENSSQKNSHANIVVIDTKNVFSRELFKQYDAGVWIGKDFIVAAKNQARVEPSDVSRVPDFFLDQAKLLRWVDIIDSYHWALSLGLFVILFFSFYGFFVLQLIWLFLIALLIMLFGKLYKITLSYKNSYQIALHAATVPFVLIALSIVSGINAPFLFFYSSVIIVIVLVNLKKVDAVSS